jgi:large subunit ribosomal protein L32
MAVAQDHKRRAKRGMRRSHDARQAPTLSGEPPTGEIHRRHHVRPRGY